MPSLLKNLVVGGLVWSAVVQSAPAPAHSPHPALITPAPNAQLLDALVKRQDGSPDAVSLAFILLTAIPASVRQIAATNLPAAGSILWEDFLDGKKPEWFEELPEEVREYLIRKFGPRTAWSTATDGASVTVTATSEEVSRTGSATTMRTSKPTSFATSRTTSSSPSSSTSKPHTISSSLNFAKPSSTPTSTAGASASTHPGLSKSQKVGLGVGIPIGLIGAAASIFFCCLLCRRRRRKHDEGSIPPASPGFIPRFAFHERSERNSGYGGNVEHHAPLNREAEHATYDAGTAWEDEGVDPMEMHGQYAWNDWGANGQAFGVPAQTHATTTNTGYHALGGNDGDAINTSYSNVPVMMMQDPTPIMAPAVYHTHTSNRARGRRTSYSSLSSVAEESEPEDVVESPVLGRHTTPPIPSGAQIKRKPVPASPPLPPLPTSPSPVAMSPAAQAASNKLLRQTMPEHSGSSSSGLALTTSSGLSSSSNLAVHAEHTPTSPISSPTSVRAPSNPFNYETYVEDYGPEYHNGYVDVDDGLYGGHTSLSQYTDPQRKNSKTERTLRSLRGSHHRRKSGPIWERLSEE